jgi:hypothetical protein
MKALKRLFVLKAGIPMCTISKQEMRKPMKNPTCGHVYDEVHHRELTCKQCSDPYIIRIRGSVILTYGSVILIFGSGSRSRM